MSADPLTVSCPDCAAPPEVECRTSNESVGQPVHAGRQAWAELASVDHGICALCARPLVRGVRPPDEGVTAWHPDVLDAEACPKLPDPAVDWNAYALAVQDGAKPGHPGLEHFRGIDTDTGAVLYPGASASCPECRAGKHDNCDGTAWDDQADGATICACAHGSHGAPS